MSSFLDASDRQSATWQKLKGYLGKRLEVLRRKNDSQKLSADETAAIRAEIAAVKGLLALERQLPPHEPDNPPDGA